MVKRVFKLDLGKLTNKNRILAAWLGGRVVMQRIANPCTPVRFRPQPPFCRNLIVFKRIFINNVRFILFQPIFKLKKLI